LTNTSAALTIGDNCGTIGTIGNQWQSVTSPCRNFRMRTLTEFTETWALYRPHKQYYLRFPEVSVFLLPR